MDNFIKMPLLQNSTEFTIPIPEGVPTSLEVLGYQIRLTKAGKEQSELLGMLNFKGNFIAENEIDTVKMYAKLKGLPFSGKGGLVYQVTGYQPIDGKEPFVNTFNPNVEKGTVLLFSKYQPVDEKGIKRTYKGANEVEYPSWNLKVEVIENNADLSDEEKFELELKAEEEALKNAQG